MRKILLVALTAAAMVSLWGTERSGLTLNTE